MNPFTIGVIVGLVVGVAAGAVMVIAVACWYRPDRDPNGATFKVVLDDRQNDATRVMLHGPVACRKMDDVFDKIRHGEPLTCYPCESCDDLELCKATK